MERATREAVGIIRQEPYYGFQIDIDSGLIGLNSMTALSRGTDGKYQRWRISKPVNNNDSNNDNYYYYHNHTDSARDVGLYMRAPEHLRIIYCF